MVTCNINGDKYTVIYDKYITTKRQIKLYKMTFNPKDNVKIFYKKRNLKKYKDTLDLSQKQSFII